MSLPLSSPTRVLFVDDDADVRKAASVLLARHGFEVLGAANPDEALSALAAAPTDVVLLDLNFGPGAVTGAEGLRCLKGLIANDPDAVVVVVTGHSGINIAVAAMRAGAADFVMKPWNNDRLVATLHDAAAVRRRRIEARGGDAEPAPAEPLIGQSPAIQRAKTLAARAAGTNAAVLITGAAGTGKTLLAQRIHRQSRRAHLSLTALDPLALWGEGEAALAAALGRIDANGTLLLDAAGAWPIALQARLAGCIAGHPELRLIATSRHERAELQGWLQAELLYRLSTVEIVLPTLRERGEDIARLAVHFLRLYARAYGRPRAELTEDAIAALGEAPWPGNVRELRQAIERAMVLAPGDALGPDEVLPARVLPGIAVGDEVENDLNLLRAERLAVEAALKRHGFNVTRAAKDLGLTRAALYRRMARHGF